MAGEPLTSEGSVSPGRTPWACPDVFALTVLRLALGGEPDTRGVSLGDVRA